MSKVDDAVCAYNVTDMQQRTKTSKAAARNKTATVLDSLKFDDYFEFIGSK